MLYFIAKSKKTGDLTPVFNNLIFSLNQGQELMQDIRNQVPGVCIRYRFKNSFWKSFHISSGNAASV